MQKFLALYDIHWGYERKNHHKVPLHDIKAINVALKYAEDFKPDHIIIGGDALDCGCISHHNHGKPGATEGMKLIEDARELTRNVIRPIEELKASTLTYIIGNHEDWLNDLEQKIPALEGMMDVKAVLALGKRWKIVPLGEGHKLGKLLFIHGDQVKGGQYPSKWAVEAYERNVRFGHFHCFQAYSKTSALEDNTKTGISIPCLCKKGPLYGGGSPNKWSQGFLWGYLNDDGSYSDYVSIITKGTATINGKVYKG
jgi:hypothetical protein